MRCPGCGHDGMRRSFEIAQAPVFCNVLHSTRSEALAADRAEIVLGFCQSCGLIYNLAYDESLTSYSPEYGNPLHCSQRFRRYADELVGRLIERYDLYGKDIIEIGCGDGDFLGRLCKPGQNRAVGFDPSFNPKSASAEMHEAITIVAEHYSTRHASRPADLVVCRHVLEHIAEPLEFLMNVRSAIGDRADAVVFFEVPNALGMLPEKSTSVNGLNIWDIIYEHCSYFTPDSLRNIFILAGFEPIEVAQTYEGQFLTIEARPSSPGAAPTGSRVKGAISRLRDAYRKISVSWARTLSRLERDSARVVLWGGGSKSVAFLSGLSVSDEFIAYVVDINPQKHNRFIPVTGQRIVSSDYLREYRPDTIIVMNSIYRSEIRRRLEQIGVEAELLTV